jgi:hypothetical protein
MVQQSMEKFLSRWITRVIFWTCSAWFRDFILWLTFVNICIHRDKKKEKNRKTEVLSFPRNFKYAKWDLWIRHNISKWVVIWFRQTQILSKYQQFDWFCKQSHKECQKLTSLLLIAKGFRRNETHFLIFHR